MTTQQPTPLPPVQSGPHTTIPHTDIPHMGTSQANIPNPSIPQAEHASQPPQPPQTVRVEMPPLPPGITQEAINTAIAQVEQTGTTEGISPEVLGAACAQLEAQAKAQGVDLTQTQASQDAQPAAPAGPSNYVEAAVFDKKKVMDGFSDQREKLKTAVSDQRDAMQQPYKDALNKAGIGGGGASTMTPETMAELASAIQDLDPGTVALINAIGAMNANPSILNSVVWIEIIRSVRAMIAAEAKKQLEVLMRASTN
ncbi:hypothetical protein [Magnetovibrio sp.]|uniref:hypothetical protein n=1 Tax=Magnetovibrio sp. TaxID=2024836 RepID=UPI002F951A60